MKYHAVIFDLDGTLLNTLEDLAGSMNAVLKQHGYPPHPVEAYKYFVGEGIERLVRRALPEAAGRDEAMVAECLTAMHEEYSRRWRECTCPYDGVPELLSQLSHQRIPMAILSNKPHDFTLLTVRELLAPWHFAEVLGERPTVPRKPDPAGALEIATRLLIPSCECLYLGDTATDMQTACAAGMHAVGVLWGFRTADELLAHGARDLIAHPLDLLSFF